MRGLLITLLALGCGDATPASPDAAHDAFVADRPRLDAPRVDAPAIDAPAADAPTPDGASPDAGCGAAWTIEPLATVGEAPSIAFDALGTMHVAFTTGYQGDIVYGRRQLGGSFATEVILPNQATWSTAITLDRNGGVHVGFQTDADEFRYGYRPPAGGWTTEPVQSPTNIAADQIVSIALDANDSPHLAFEFDDTQVEMTHAFKATSGAWVLDVVEGVGSAGGGGPRIAMMATGARMAYPVVNANLRYAAQGGGGAWTIEPLPAHPEEVALAVEPDGVSHLLYAAYNGTAVVLLHSSRDASGAWTTETAATADEAPATCSAGCFPGFLSSLVLDADGGLHASFAVEDRTSATTYQVLVRYAYRAPGGGWTNDYIDGAGAYAGIFNALALDPAGGVHVVYTLAATNTGPSSLMHATRCR